MLRTVMLLVPMLLLVGCASMPKRFPGVPPEVSLANITVQEMTLMEMEAVFTVRIDNENPDPIQVSGGTHRFYINGDYVGKGLSNAKTTIEPFTSFTTDVTVHLGNIAMAKQIQRLIDSQRIGYRLESMTYIKFAKGNYAVKSEKEDMLDLSGFASSPNAHGPNRLLNTPGLNPPGFVPTPIAPGVVPATPGVVPAPSAPSSPPDFSAPQSYTPDER